MDHAACSNPRQHNHPLAKALHRPDGGVDDLARGRQGSQEEVLAGLVGPAAGRGEQGRQQRGVVVAQPNAELRVVQRRVPGVDEVVRTEFGPSRHAKSVR